VVAGGLLWGQGAIQALFIDDKGNVGIGKTPPDYKLDVSGSIGIGNNRTGSANRLYLAGSDKNHYIYSSGTSGNVTYLGEWGGNFNFVNTGSGANVMTISDDNVVIGTKDRRATLDVNGSLRVSGYGDVKQALDSLSKRLDILSEPNLALGKPTKQSTTPEGQPEWSSSRGVDGRTRSFTPEKIPTRSHGGRWTSETPTPSALSCSSTGRSVPRQTHQTLRIGRSLPFA